MNRGRERGQSQTRPSEAAAHSTLENSVDNRAGGINMTSASRLDGTISKREDDAASTVAQSTISGYAPSDLTERRYLLSNGRHSTAKNESLQKTTGRKAYLQAAKALDLVIPIDMNSETTSMRDSSIAKLGKVLRRTQNGSLSRS
jgi:hypothetical protein